MKGGEVDHNNEKIMREECKIQERRDGTAIKESMDKSVKAYGDERRLEEKEKMDERMRRMKNIPEKVKGQ